MSDLWDKEFQLMVDLEIKHKVKTPVASKYISFYGNLAKSFLMNHFFEVQLLSHIEQKVQRWHNEALEDAKEKRELRYKNLIDEFQKYLKVLTAKDDVQSNYQ